MKIALASCVCTHVFKDQPVWEHIAAAQPDFLVLLGDSLYLDINPAVHPEQLDDDGFGKLLHKRYTELLKQKQFVALVRQLGPGRVFSIWDDHDFLWNDAAGAAYRNVPLQRNKIRLSTAFHEAFRQALALGLPSKCFPTVYSDPVFWNPHQPALRTDSIALSDQIVLHLCDVRSFRTNTFLVPESKRTILGAEQRRQIEAALLSSAPDAIHLLASGSTLAAWKRYAKDLGWLHGLAKEHRMIVLSGDIHRNDVDAFYTGGFPLHEVTSSGAAVRDAVTIGAQQQNFGFVEISGTDTIARLFHFNAREKFLDRDFDNATWLPK